ncbi:hypothetical protein [Streptomyces viridochromogenes]|uniref:Uncharacterized protein n=1 Tax=Streptomyces viridochromogenes Tue57 TaxID=1160705 RepID=L8PKX8_STRVR|nr:hypothetical protein [Streptomyces viridochromogenes]ELS56939.1 hypothetical protein STVIR_2107 [Streptomyces viridochromogenes Tue57]
MAGALEEHRTAEQYEENNNKARAAEQQRNHDRLIESDKVARNSVPYNRATENGKTPFIEYSVNGLRKMIMDSQPGKISEVGTHWKMVHNILSGGDGDGATGGVDQVSAKDSVAGMLKSAVDAVLEHWEGEAAQAFKRRADDIAVQIRNGAAHANFTAEQLFAISKDLDAAKAKMADIHEPSKLESAGDKMNDNSNRDDSQAHKDLAAGVSAGTVAEANEKNLSLGMERRLQAVAVMEQLAANYKVYGQNLRSGKPINDREGVSPPSPDVTMPPPIAMPSASAGGPGRAGAAKPWSAGATSSIKPAPAVPRDAGITGGSQLPTTRTKVDSISPGLTGTGPSTGPAGVSGGSGGLGTGGTQGPGAVAPGGVAGLGRGAAARGGIGATGGRGGLTGGGAAAGRGAGGRAGMGGMGGAGAGAAGRGGAGAGGRGALAKSRGGVVGAAKGVTGKGAGGGAGLHGSRGGTQRGAVAGGMAGGMGGRNGRRSEENSQGDRPDYLVEDEETWISEEDRNRNVPRTIE